ncbi:cysteine proteinase [Sparassis latifolia]|uniref:ubiquitinyl hydrolase 1 n=1 Tax=Sparassis crispa TaxID=139825 RepID=A0A401GJD0_9APHY|nr:cysteine proteinase [Sparassis crispa]GBE82261.1 cysteine proteinase [Sparassis crispa]
MPPKRTRRSSPTPAGLSAGERLKRARLAGNTQYSTWGWVGTEITDASAITLEHRLATCGFLPKSSHPLCANKYAARARSTSVKEETKQPQPKAHGELEDDVIVISDDEAPSCSSKACRSTPYCLNYLGQEKWEDEGKAREAFMKVTNLGEDPVANSRDPGFPVGLKNLGATCYANAYLQVWFQDLPFRDGVYKCQPAQDAEHKFEESPIFQLQVTFAAMQEGIESAFNPVKLVESLKLRTAEQQDAQEFSKLFMAHLDTEFHKQSSPSLKSLIADQFQGKQVYGTICEKCHNSSERESDFLEIEVNIQNNATLEDRITALLQPETLSGDNKYLCPRCDSLQDAKRYTELRQLPPVLHFSLLRFVYDVSTMERKKSKYAISFPTSIDMDQFLGSAEMRKNAKNCRKNTNRYALRGVLLHKGASAYHGHYEAQVFDVQNQGWYQFNDETVTEIESLGAKPISKAKVGPAADAEKKKAAGQSQKPRIPQRKRRRVESDSDIEILDSPPPANGSKTEPEAASYISSKDAYMLVYSRIDMRSSELTKNVINGKAPHRSYSPQANGSAHAHSQITIPSPPPRAMEAVRMLNAAHDQACEEFTEKEKQAKAHFNDMRYKVMDIYRSWQLSTRDEDCVVASRQALETWISRHLAKPKKRAASPSESDETPSRSFTKSEISDEEGRNIISVSDIVCSHGQIDPDKASDMKLITRAAHHRIADDDNCLLVPDLSPLDVCETCVSEMFTERLYQIEHPRFVARFDEIAPVAENEEGYWISKQWLKDWRLAKPKMHNPSQGDPPPDAPDFKYHVKCEHDDLSTNVTARRRVSVEACLFLQDLFPTWEPLSTETEVCPVCEALIHISKEDKRELRRQAEEEKAKLKHMHDNALNGNTALLENVPCAIVPAHFVRAWRQWLLHPVEVQRPESVDNSQFLCEHGLLCLDPNSGTDLDSSVAIIKRSDWDVLEDIYSGGPLIAVENTGTKLEHELSVCEDCRRKRKSSFDMTEITVRILGPQDPTPTVETYKPDTVQTTRRPLHPSTLMTYGSRKSGGLRQSNRLRQAKDYGKRRRVTITKNMRVKDLKITFEEEFDIPIISQRLFYHGQELDDSSATVLSLGILSNDLLDLREESENIDLLSDSDTEDVPRKRRNEGQGFGGTLLGGIPDSDSDGARESSSQSDQPPATSKACSACTYENDIDVAMCAICETPFNP